MFHRIRSLASFLLAGSLVCCAWAAAPVSAQSALTNESILRLVRAGVPDAIIESEIRGVPCNFDVRAESLAALEEAGVSARVRERMVETAVASGTKTSDAVSRATQKPDVTDAPVASAAHTKIWNQLGLVLGPASREAAAQTSAGPPAMLIVLDVMARGAAASVGVQRGDLVTRINGHRVSSLDDVVERLDRLSPAQSTVVGVVRQRREIDILVPPGRAGDIAPPPPWASAVAGREVYPYVRAVGMAGPPSTVPVAPTTPTPSRPERVPVAIALRFPVGDPAPRLITSVALVADGVTVRETAPSIDGVTVRAAFGEAPDGIATGRAYEVEVVTLFGRRRLAVLDLTAAAGPADLTIEVAVDAASAEPSGASTTQRAR